MNVVDLQDDDYDDYDDYGDVPGIEAMPSTLSGYSQQPPPPEHTGISYLPTAYQPEQASASYSPPATAYQPEPASASYSPPAGGSSYGSGGLGNMSSMGSSLPSTSPPVQTSKYGGGDKCPRCGKTVYFAEAKEGPNNIKYHKCVLLPCTAHCVRTSWAVGFSLTPAPWLYLQDVLQMLGLRKDVG